MKNGLWRPAARLGTLIPSSGSVVLHGGILLILFAASYLRVEALDEPSAKPPALLSIALPAAAPAAAPPPSRQPKANAESARETEPIPEDIPAVIQPQGIPDEPPISQEDAGETPGVDGGIDGGIEGGIIGGDPEGTVGGVLGGDDSGVADGGKPGGVAGDDTPLYLTGEVRPPERTTFVKPDYPEMARRVRAEGKVILGIVVGRTGEVEMVRVLRSHPLFDQAAVEAVMKWKYQPALQNGRPVKVYLTVIVDFGLK